MFCRPNRYADDSNGVYKYITSDTPLYIQSAFFIYLPDNVDEDWNNPLPILCFQKSARKTHPYNDQFVVVINSL